MGDRLFLFGLAWEEAPKDGFAMLNPSYALLSESEAHGVAAGLHSLSTCASTSDGFFTSFSPSCAA
jgi:hypothetical protein